jgi:F420-0:gamma-glutamyl ligase
MAINIKAIRTHIFKEHEPLVAFVEAHIRKIPEKSVLVIASKIVALSEGRTAKAKHLPIRLTVTDHMLMANAGMDESNADGRLILLPKDSYASAGRLRKELKKIYRVKKLGVIISDSHIAPLRAGVTAHALGYAGIKGVRDYRGTKDLFGRTMRISRVNVADSLATAAALAMGEGAEKQPMALITNAPVEFIEKIKKNETSITAQDDMYWPLLKTIRKKR